MTAKDDSAIDRDTYRLESSLWSFAPDDWVTPDQNKEFRVTEAKMVGKPGNEELVVEIERYDPDGGADA